MSNQRYFWSRLLSNTKLDDKHHISNLSSRSPHCDCSTATPTQSAAYPSIQRTAFWRLVSLCHQSTIHPSFHTDYHPRHFLCSNSTQLSKVRHSHKDLSQAKFRWLRLLAFSGFGFGFQSSFSRIFRSGLYKCELGGLTTTTSSTTTLFLLLLFCIGSGLGDALDWA